MIKKITINEKKKDWPWFSPMDHSSREPVLESSDGDSMVPGSTID